MKSHAESIRWLKESALNLKSCPACGSHASFELFDPGESEPQRDSREFVYCRSCGLVLSFLMAITSKNSK